MTLDQRSLQIWSLLVCAARERRIYTYGDVAAILGFGGAGTMANMLGSIMWFCRDRELPAHTVVVVNGTTGRPGEGIVLDNDIDGERERAFGFDWFAIGPPETGDFRNARENHE